MFCPLPLAFLDAFGGPELLLIMFLVLILFGGEKLPSVARTIGKSMRELKKASADIQEEIKKAMDEPPAAPPKPAPPKTIAQIAPPEVPVVPPAPPPPEHKFDVQPTRDEPI